MSVVNGITFVGPKVEKPSDRAWWKSATVYQIYPVRMVFV